MPFSLRLDPETEAMIRRLARATGRSRSAVVREAMARYGAVEDAAAPAGASTFDRLGSVVGIVKTGGADLSVNTHAKFRARLKADRGRRSR
jgi:hypothetical protein